MSFLEILWSLIMLATALVFAHKLSLQWESPNGMLGVFLSLYSLSMWAFIYLSWDVCFPPLNLWLEANLAGYRSVYDPMPTTWFHSAMVSVVWFSSLVLVVILPLCQRSLFRNLRSLLTRHLLPSREVAVHGKR